MKEATVCPEIFVPRSEPTPPSTQVLLLALVLALACGGSEPPPHTAGAAPPTKTAPSPAPEAPSAEAAAPPTTGHARIRITDEGLTLIAIDTPRRPLLEVLAAQLDFKLVPGDVGSEPVTVRIEGGHLRDALPSLLPDRAYRVEYRFDKQTGRHQVARLEIAPSGAIAFVAPPDYVVPDYVPDLEGPFPAARFGSQPDGVPPTGTEGRSRADVDWKALVLRLDDADADERIEALDQIDPEGDGLPLIVDRLARDPDPKVRAAAAEKLEFADTLAGVDALVRALSDPDKQVVLAAIDALEFTEDYTVTQDLATLLDHPDEEIREAAEDAIDFIGDLDEDEE